MKDQGYGSLSNIIFLIRIPQMPRIILHGIIPRMEMEVFFLDSPDLISVEKEWIMQLKKCVIYTQKKILLLTIYMIKPISPRVQIF